MAKTKTKKRPVDELASKSYSQLRKMKIKTWKGVFIIAFLAGIVGAFALMLSNSNSGIFMSSDAKVSADMPSAVKPIMGGKNTLPPPTTGKISCSSDKNCGGINCPMVVGGDKQKCDFKTKTCYCGGKCGDKYCDTVEKRDNTCPKDCKVATEAYFRFMDNTNMFIIKLTDPKKIQQARDILSGKEKVSTHVMGIIVGKQADYNKQWHYYLDPSSIIFWESAIEVCDGSIQWVEDEIKKKVSCAGFPSCRWCPWSSKLVEEVSGPGASI